MSLRIVCAFAIVIALWTLVAPSVAAAPPEPPDDRPPKDPGPVQKVVESVTQVLHIIRFPVPDMVDAIQGSLRALLGMQKDQAGIFEGAPMTIQISFGRMIHNVLGCGSLDVPSDSVNCALGYSPKKEIWQPIWQVVLYVSMALWPLTLAILVVVTAKNASLSGAVGWADLKTGIGEWILMGILAAGSLFILDYTGRLFDFVAVGILSAGIDSKEIAPSIAGTLLNTGILWALMYIPGGIFFAIFYLTLGFTVLTCLVGAYVARYALMFVLICLAPLTLTLGVLPPARWLSWSWLRGYVIVALIAPVNALLMRAAALVYITAGTSIGKENFAGYLLNLTATLGILSLLITLDYEIARFTFGAVMQVAQQAWATTREIVTLAVAAVAGIAAGVAAAPAAAGAGVAAGASGGGAAAASTEASAATGATSTASATGSSATSAQAGRASAAGSAGAADGTRNSGANSMRSMLSRMTGGRGFSPSAALRASGNVMRAGSRSSGGRALGAALSGVGDSLGQEEHERESQQREADHTLQRGEDAVNRAANDVLAGAGINPYSAEGREMAGELTRLSRQYGDAPTHAAARATLSPDAPALPGESAAQKVNRLMAPALVGQGAARAAEFPQWDAGLRNASGPYVTPDESAMGAHLARGLGIADPARSAAYGELVNGLRLAGEQSFAQDPSQAAAYDANPAGVDVAPHLQHVSAVAGILYDVRQQGGSFDQMRGEFGKRFDDYAARNHLDTPAFGPAWEQEHRRLRSA